MLIKTETYEYLTFLIVFIFLIAIGISIRKKKIRRTWILMISLVVIVSCSIVFSVMSSTLYVINEDYSCTEYHVFGNTVLKFDSPITMKSKSLEYIIDPNPGKVMVVNRSFTDLYLKPVPFKSSSMTMSDDYKIPAWTAKTFDIPRIDYLPNDPAGRNAFLGGTSSGYWLDKNN